MEEPHQQTTFGPDSPMSYTMQVYRYQVERVVEEQTLTHYLKDVKVIIQFMTKQLYQELIVQ